MEDMGPCGPQGCDWFCHVNPAPEHTSDLLCCLFWPLLHPTATLYWLFLYGQAGTTAAEGPAKRKAASIE